EWKVKVVFPQFVDNSLRLILEAEIAGDQGEAGAPRPVYRIRIDESLDDRCDLGKPPLLAANREHLHAVNSARNVAVRPPSQAMSRFSEFFGRGEVSGQHGLHCPCLLHDPLAMAHLPALAERMVLVHVRGQSLPIARFRREKYAESKAAHMLLDITGPLRDRQHLVQALATLRHLSRRKGLRRQKAGEE